MAHLCLRQHRALAVVFGSLVWLGLAAPAAAQLGSVPYTFTAGTTIVAAQVNTDFSTVYSNALNRTAGTMTGTLTTQSLLPSTTATYDLGLTGTRYRHLWLSGNAAVGGTLAVTGASTLTGAVAVAGDFAVATSKFTVAAASGNSTIAGTLAVTGAVTLTGGLNTPLVLAQGGSSAALTASNGGIVYSTASAMAILSGTSTSGQMLQSGASTTPAWSTATFPATAGSAGLILRANGTNWVATTSTFADTYGVSTLLYASSANVVAGLATAASSILVTNGSSVPAWTTTLPAHTLGGTVSGGGNQVNNVIIGTSTPLAGSFTTLVASTSISSPSHITASGALTLTPAAGSNVNISLSTTGDFAVNTNQLYVDTSTATVGIGTTAPDYLDGSLGAATPPMLAIAGSGSSMLTLSTSATADTQIVGQILFGSTGASTKKTSAEIYSDLTGSGATNASGTLRFMTRSGASLTERLTILSGGNVGISTTNPSYQFQVATIFAVSGSYAGVANMAPSPTASHVCTDTATLSGYNAFAVCSSLRELKDEITPINLDRRVLQLTPVSYREKSSAPGTRGAYHVGLIAEDVNATLGDEYSIFYNGKLRGVNYDAIGPSLIPIVRDHDQRLDAIEARLALLEVR